MSDRRPDPGGLRDNPRRRFLWPTIAAVLALIVVIASAGAAFAFRSDEPGADSAEAGFLRDMVTHHGQAVEMSLIVYRRTADDDVVTMTYDMATTQQSQIGMMIATLDLWGLSQTGSDPAMSWMGHPTTGPMPGMATPEQVDLLRTLPPEQADALLLQLMIVHHRAGVEMASSLLDRSDNADVRRLAEAFSRSQDIEIANMNAMLVARGQAPVDGSAVPGMTGMDMTTDATPGNTDHGG